MTLLKRTIKNSMQGIGIACTLYLLFGMISDQHNHGCFVLENWLFTKQAIGTILVGIAFSAPTEIYHSNRLPFLLQVLFHLGIGCTAWMETLCAHHFSSGRRCLPHLARLCVLLLETGKDDE